jgi:hypothetical protein
VSFAGEPSNPTAAHYWPFVVMSPADAADAGIPAMSARAAPESRIRSRAHVHRYSGSVQRRLVSRLADL